MSLFRSASNNTNNINLSYELCWESLLGSNDIFALLIAESIWLAVGTAFASVRLGSTNSLTNFSVPLSSRVLQHSVLLRPRDVAKQKPCLPGIINHEQAILSCASPHLFFLRNYFSISKEKDWNKRANPFTVPPRFVLCYFFKYLQAALSCLLPESLYFSLTSFLQCILQSFSTLVSFCV